MPYTYRDIARRLNKLGFVIVRQRGSHVIFSNGRTTIPVPNHASKTISIGVERSIIKSIGSSKNNFQNLL